MENNKYSIKYPFIVRLMSLVIAVCFTCGGLPIEKSLALQPPLVTGNFIDGKKGHGKNVITSQLGVEIGPAVINGATYDSLLSVLKDEVGYKVPEEIKAGNAGIIRRDDLLYPDGVNIVIFFKGIPGIELSGLIAAERGVEGVNFIYMLLPALFAAGNNPQRVFAEGGVVINRYGKLIYGQFEEPLAIDGVAYSGGASSVDLLEFFEARNVPIVSPTKVLKFSADKVKMKQLLQRNRLDTPRYRLIASDAPKAKVRRAIKDFIRKTKAAGFVLKPTNESMGTGVKMFNEYEIEEAVEHAAQLQGKGKRILLEERIVSRRWLDYKGRRIDWNVRVLATWDNGNAVTGPDMIEVRYGPYNSAPVNKSRGADVMLLEEFFEKAVFSEAERTAFFRPLARTVKKAMRDLAQECGARPGLIGWDLIRQEGTGRWFILEANAGGVGGISTMEKLHSPEDKGDTIMPLIRYLKQMAGMYRRTNGFYPAQAQSLDGDKTRFPLEANALIDIAEALHNKGEYIMAEKILRRVLDLDVKMYKAWNDLAVSLFKQGRDKEAEDAARKAIELNAEMPLAWVNLGLILSEQGRHIEAKIAIRRAIDLNNKIPTVWLKYAMILSSQGAYKDAEDAAREAISLDDKMPQAWVNLGVQLFWQHRYEEAEAAYRRAISLDDTMPVVWGDLASALYEQDRYEEAESAYRKALSLYPDAAGGWNNLGIILSEQEKYEEAEAAYRRALSLKDDMPRAYVNLSIIFFRQKRYKDAEEAAREALSLDPDMASAWKNLAIALSGQQRYPEERQVLEEAFEKFDDLDIAVILMLAFDRDKEFYRAGLLYERVAEPYKYEVDRILSDMGKLQLVKKWKRKLAQGILRSQIPQADITGRMP